MNPKRLCAFPFATGAAALLFLAATVCPAQQSLTWEQVKSKFEAANPALKADVLGVDEMRAEEISAYLRPNPQFTTTADGTQIAPNNGHWQPLQGTFVEPECQLPARARPQARAAPRRAQKRARASPHRNMKT